jgi:hypothetical protein
VCDRWCLLWAVWGRGLYSRLREFVGELLRSNACHVSFLKDLRAIAVFLFSIIYERKSGYCYWVFI